jgi:hypothetical protein
MTQERAALLVKQTNPTFLQIVDGQLFAWTSFRYTYTWGLR